MASVTHQALLMVNTAASSCPTSAAFLARTSGLDATHVAAYNELICGLVSDGIWPKLDILHIYATQDTTTAQLNLVSASYPATIHGAPTFTADRGYTGTSGSAAIYIDTGFNPTTATTPNYVRDSAHISVWSVTNVTDTVAAVGSANAAGASNAYILPRYTPDNFTYWRVNVGTTNNPSFNVGTGAGHFLGSRTGATTLGCYLDATLKITDTLDSSTAVTNLNLYSLGINNNGTAAGNANQQAMISVGSSLSAGEVTLFYNRLRTYMTAVGVP